MQRSAPRDALLFRRNQLGTASTYVCHRNLFGCAWLIGHLIGRAIKSQDSLGLTTEYLYLQSRLLLYLLQKLLAIARFPDGLRCNRQNLLRLLLLRQLFIVLQHLKRFFL